MTLGGSLPRMRQLSFRFREPAINRLDGHLDLGELPPGDLAGGRSRPLGGDYVGVFYKLAQENVFRQLQGLPG